MLLAGCGGGTKSKPKPHADWKAVAKATVDAITGCIGADASSPPAKVRNAADTLIREYNRQPDAETPKGSDLKPRTLRAVLQLDAEAIQRCSPQDADRIHAALSEK